MVKAQANFSDFSKLDLRIGKVVEAKEVDESDKLMRLTVDLGKDYGIKTIFAGVKGIVEINDLINKQFIFVANLAPRKMMEEESQGMMLAMDVDNKPVLINVGDNIPTGAIVR